MPRSTPPSATERSALADASDMLLERAIADARQWVTQFKGPSHEQAALLVGAALERLEHAAKSAQSLAAEEFLRLEEDERAEAAPHLETWRAQLHAHAAACKTRLGQPRDVLDVLSFAPAVESYLVSESLGSVGKTTKQVHADLTLKIGLRELVKVSYGGDVSTENAMFRGWLRDESEPPLPPFKLRPVLQEPAVELDYQELAFRFAVAPRGSSPLKLFERLQVMLKTVCGDGTQGGAKQLFGVITDSAMLATLAEEQGYAVMRIAT